MGGGASVACEAIGQPNHVSKAHLVLTGIVHANSGRPHPRLANASTRWLVNP